MKHYPGQKADVLNKDHKKQTEKTFGQEQEQCTEMYISSCRRKNMLTIPAVCALVKNRLFPSSLQWLNLVLFSAVLYFAWGETDETLRYTNVGSWVVWTIWWPLVIGATLFAGRIWCTMCHLRLVSDCFSGIGLNLDPPKVLEKHGIPVTLTMMVGLIILHSSVVSYDVHHIPHFTAIYLVILLIYAVAIGVVFKKGSFCRLFCPLVAFLGPYSQLSPTELRIQELGPCLKGGISDKKPCIRSCSNGILIPEQNSNESCILCFSCVKICPNDNIRFSFRPFLSDLLQCTNRSWVPAVVPVLLLGIIFQELGEEWDVFESLTLFLPKWISGHGIPETILGGYMWLETLWVNVVLPLLILLSAGTIARAFSPGRRISVMSHVKLYSVALLPMVFCMHLAKLLKNFNGKLGYVAYVFSDPLGHETAAAIKAGTLALPLPFFVTDRAMGHILIALVCCGVCASIYAMVRIADSAYPDEFKTGTLTVAPFVALFVILGIGFLLTIYNWLIV